MELESVPGTFSHTDEVRRFEAKLQKLSAKLQKDETGTTPRSSSPDQTKHNKNMLI